MLDKATIKAEIVAMQAAEDQDEAADKLADLIINAIKSLAATGTTANACTAGGSPGTCTITLVE